MSFALCLHLSECDSFSQLIAFCLARDMCDPVRSAFGSSNFNYDYRQRVNNDKIIRKSNRKTKHPSNSLATVWDNVSRETYTARYFSLQNTKISYKIPTYFPWEIQSVHLADGMLRFYELRRIKASAAKICTNFTIGCMQCGYILHSCTVFAFFHTLFATVHCALMFGCMF